MGRYSKMLTTQQLTTDPEFLQQALSYLSEEQGDKFDPMISEFEELAPGLLLFHANVRNGAAQWTALFADIRMFRPNGGLPKSAKVDVSPACHAWKLTEALLNDLRRDGWSLYFASSRGEDAAFGDERHGFIELERSLGLDFRRRKGSGSSDQF